MTSENQHGHTCFGLFYLLGRFYFPHSFVIRNGSLGGIPLFSGLFTVHFFGSIQMVMVSKSHGYKWFAVMVFTLLRLEHGWLRKNSVCCGPVYGPWSSLRFGYGAFYDSRLSLRVGFRPVCIQHLSSRTATSPMPSTLGMH